jgi:hypothetical protein
MPEADKPNGTAIHASNLVQIKEPEPPTPDLELDEARSCFERGLAARYAGDDRAQALLQLSLALLGGAVAVVMFVFSRSEMQGSPAGLLIGTTAIGVICNLAAAFMFVQAYSGFGGSRHRVWLGPSPGELYEARAKMALAGDLAVAKGLRAEALSIYTNEFRLQLNQSDEEASLRRRGLRTLALSLGLYVGGLAVALVWAGIAAS